MYRKVNIKTMEELSQRIGVPLDLIVDLKARKSDHYHSGKVVPGTKRAYTSISKQGKQVLKRLNRFLAHEIDHPDYVHGGILDKGIRSNAKPHAAKKYLMKLDIRKFFPSVNPAMVAKAMEDHVGLSHELAEEVAEITCHEGQLITGSPTSLLIATLVIRQATERIYGAVKQRGGEMTVYVDDIAVSGGAHLFELMPKCIEWIEEIGVAVHEKKRYKLGEKALKTLTGMDVTHGMDAPRGFRRKAKTLGERLAKKVADGHQLLDKEVKQLSGTLMHYAQLNPGAGKAYMRKYEHLLKPS